MRLLLLLLRQSAFPLLLSVAAGIAAGLAGSAVLAVVNERLGHMDTGWGREAWLFCLLALIAVVAKTGSKLLLTRASTRIVRDLRVNLCDRILRAPLRTVERHGKGALTTALTEDIGRIATALIALPEQCANATIATACFAYLFWLSWPLALVYLGIFLVGILDYRLVARRAKPAMKQARALWDQLIEGYSDLVHGNKELKLHRERREAFMAENIGATAEHMMTYSWRWNWILALANAHTQMIFFALMGTALFLVPHEAVEMRVLSGFILMSLYMGTPISSLVGAIPDFNQAEIAIRKIESLGLSLDGGDHRDMQAAPQVAETGPLRQIDLVDACYSYEAVPGETGFALGPISLTIAAGELLYVIGGNGSGKSSFARVLTGLYPVTSGQLRINGQGIDDSNRDVYRQNFATVFSDYHLFTSLYGLASPQRLARAQALLASLDLSHKVSLEGGRVSTVDLSTGQRKRLALLTALLEDRELFVFDEWAADQDPVFKRVFYSEILPQLKAQGKTVIVISHDSQYFELADRVVRFDEGRIVEQKQIAVPIHGAAEPALSS